MIIAYIINFIRRYRQTIFTHPTFRSFCHHTNHAFYDVIHIRKVALTVPIIKYLDFLTFQQLIGKTKVSHIRTTCRTIYRKETETCGRNVIKFRVSMCHQFITFFCSSIEAHGIIHLVIGRIRHLFVRAIHARRRSIDQVFHPLPALIIRMAAGFQYIIKANQIAFDIGTRIRDAITHPRLCCQIHNNLRLILIKQLVDKCFVGYVSFDKDKSVSKLRQLLQPPLLDVHIIIGIQIVQTHYKGIELFLQQAHTEIAADKTGSSSY